jgi:hypothetical protein
MGQDLRKTLGSQLGVNEVFEDYFGLVTRVWSHPGMAETDDFLGIVAERWGDCCDSLADAPVRIMGGVDGEFSRSICGRSMFPRALSRYDGRFRILDKACGFAETTQTNSKPMEQWFSAPSKNARGQRCTLRILNHYMCKNGWAASKADPLDITETTYRAAEEVALLPGMNEMYRVDTAKGELMRTDEQRQKFPAHIKNGGNWKKPNYVGDGRTKKFQSEAKDRDVVNQRARLVRTVCSHAGTYPPPGPPRKPIQAALTALTNKKVASTVSPSQHRQLSDPAALGVAVCSYLAADALYQDDAQAADHPNDLELVGVEDEGQGVEAQARGSPDEGDVSVNDLESGSPSSRSELSSPTSRSARDLDVVPLASTVRFDSAESNLGMPGTQALADKVVQALEQTDSYQVKANDARQLEIKNVTRSDGWGANVDHNIFSYQFCFDVADHMKYKADTWMKSDIVFGGDDRSVSAQVTRRFKKQGRLEIDDISFSVAPLRGGTEGTNTRYFFIVFDEFAGACLADVFQLQRPSCNNWKKTMMYRRIWTTKEASTRTDSTANTQGGHLGSKSLKKILDTGIDMYHSGDCKYEGDIRKLIGVVRWYSESYECEADLPKGFHLLYPRADAIKVGSHFSEQVSRGS